MCLSGLRPFGHGDGQAQPEGRKSQGGDQGICLFVKTHRNKLRRLQYSKNWNQIERLFLKSTVLFLEQIMKEKFPDLKITYENRNVLLNFYACGMEGILLAYTGEEEEEDEKFISQIDWIISRR